MGRINSRAKGARGEREFRDWLIERGHTARRGQQYSGGNESPDVVSDLDAIVHWEVKRTETCQPYAYLTQAMEDAEVTQIPVVVHKQSHKEWIAIVRADDLLKLIESFALARAPKPTSVEYYPIPVSTCRLDGRDIAADEPKED